MGEKKSQETLSRAGSFAESARYFVQSHDLAFRDRVIDNGPAFDLAIPWDNKPKLRLLLDKVKHDRATRKRIPAYTKKSKGGE